MRKIALNQILKHRRSVIKEEKKLNEFIQECSLWSRQQFLQCFFFVVSEMY